ncbi:Unannotated [Lentimonas sp. CC19]|nr:Unannotated [Lentimonas sp. CC6]CAA6689677.1 Unannotated [Lentimonas sp. CC19]CAA6692705.1 Unannotated [Lentimonas sp. CC10]CAA7069266.1 Unannotated [Lentimonas sp. CC11]CAA7077024.1 Unannotated [Lentimonas sp. CC4]CAA7168896.1 Unannotated [Lentimonas sp. CC21]CAA7180740.1 Unannotated [Lentimonas sp. CC8]
MKRSSYSDRLRIALEGSPKDEEEKENSIDILRATVPLGLIFALASLMICGLEIYTGLTHWQEWLQVAFFTTWLVYSCRLSWKSYRALKKLQTKPEPVDADNQITRP